MSRSEKLIKAVKDDLITNEDGYVVFWPLSARGFLSANDLRILADEIDRRNESWEKQMQEYFEGEENVRS